MTTWFRKLWSRQNKLTSRVAAKRLSRTPSFAGCGTEKLELRTLLSARGLADSAVAAEVAPHHAKAKFTPPDVAGTWTVTGGQAGGTLTFTQDGANVTYTGTSDLLPPISGSTKFKSKHVNALVDHTKVQTEAGTMKVKTVITFAPNESEPQTLSGQFVLGKNNSIPFTGTKDA